MDATDVAFRKQRRSLPIATSVIPAHLPSSPRRRGPSTEISPYDGRHWIRNSSDKDITFSQCGRVDVGLVVVARDNGKEHFAEIIPFDGFPLFISLLLPPGHITKVKEFTIKLGARGEDNAELHWAVLALPPGEYKLHATWSDSHPWVTHVGDWTGELTTGEVDFRIVDRLWR